MGHLKLTPQQLETLLDGCRLGGGNTYELWITVGGREGKEDIRLNCRKNEK